MENTVILLGHYGGDKTHALSAWCSTYKETGVELPRDVGQRIEILFDGTQKQKKKHYKDLLKFLAEEKHHTPFEKSSLHFLVTSDIASHIHLLKHRVGVSVNSESARYKEMIEDRFHVPEDWPEEEKLLYIEKTKESFEQYHLCIKRLEAQGLSRKRAKESARFYLPYGLQYTSDVLFNFRSFMHFQELRNSEHAQLEIKLIAQEMLKQVKELKSMPFEYSLKAFGY
jgi:thymidylate synthase (FAD)